MKYGLISHVMRNRKLYSEHEKYVIKLCIVYQPSWDPLAASFIKFDLCEYILEESIKTG